MNLSITIGSNKRLVDLSVCPSQIYAMIIARKPRKRVGWDSSVIDGRCAK